MSTPSALGAIALGLVAALANGAAFASVLVGISAALVLALRRYSHRHFGGVTGACLAAVCHLLELAILALAVWFSYPLEP
jgi:cobalamin synthase